MINEEIEEKLREINIENFIWIIYIGIIIASWYANTLEKKYFLYDDLKSREIYRKIIICIFAVLIIVYLYFLNDAYDAIKKLTPYDSQEKINLTKLAFVGSLLITISGFIFFYIAIQDENIDVEIAFN